MRDIVVSLLGPPFNGLVSSLQVKREPAIGHRIPIVMGPMGANGYGEKAQEGKYEIVAIADDQVLGIVEPLALRFRQVPQTMPVSAKCSDEWHAVVASQRAALPELPGRWVWGWKAERLSEQGRDLIRITFFPRCL